jgi:hypothetical protein
METTIAPWPDAKKGRSEKVEGSWRETLNSRLLSVAKGLKIFLSASPLLFHGDCADDTSSHPCIDPRMWGWRLNFKNAGGL